MPREKRVPSPDQETKAKVAAIYCRVSTAEQGQSGLSLKDQEERCRGLCVAKDWEVHRIYTDVASAGSLDRPEFTRMVRDAVAGKIDVVVAPEEGLEPPTWWLQDSPYFYWAWTISSPVPIKWT